MHKYNNSIEIPGVLNTPKPLSIAVVCNRCCYRTPCACWKHVERIVVFCRQAPLFSGHADREPGKWFVATAASVINRCSTRGRVTISLSPAKCFRTGNVSDEGPTEDGSYPSGTTCGSTPPHHIRRTYLILTYLTFSLLGRFFRAEPKTVCPGGLVTRNFQERWILQKVWA